jgi:uncharacterized small protein (DUF1192 family)
MIKQEVNLGGVPTGRFRNVIVDERTDWIFTLDELNDRILQLQKEIDWLTEIKQQVEKGEVTEQVTDYSRKVNMVPDVG